MEQEKNKLKNYLIGLTILLFIGYSFYWSFFRTTNEIGFLGADKSGRQVLIQTLDSYYSPDVRVDSDFFDYTFISRIMIQEPMRTTIRFDIQNEKNTASLSSVENFLTQPYNGFIDNFKEKIFMQDGYEITPEELKESLSEKNVKTMEDFLAGFGFKKFQIYEKGIHKLTVEIKGNKNVYWAGE